MGFKPQQPLFFLSITEHNLENMSVLKQTKLLYPQVLLEGRKGFWFATRHRSQDYALLNDHGTSL